MKYNICFVLGGPGAGKGTICERIVKEYGFVHLSAGELLRQAQNSFDSKYKDEIQTHMKQGTIVPAYITCGLLLEAMKTAHQTQGCEYFLIDGFPRNENNKSYWMSEMDSITTLKRVLVLDCPDNVCIQRCMGRCSGRIDDNLETLNRRLHQFREQCLPIIQYYEALNLVSRIDGSQSKDKVFQSIKTIMDSIMNEA